MLIQSDIHELGDKRLDPKETVAREREELLKLASTRKISGQHELEDAERSAGPRLYYTEIIRRIREGNPSIQILEGAPGQVAIYRIKRREEYDGSEVDETRQASGFHPDFFKDHVYVTGMPKDWLPEYSHVILDTSNLPVREIRGWRSVLMALIKARAITYSHATEQFGEANGSRASRWHEQLRRYKN